MVRKQPGRNLLVGAMLSTVFGSLLLMHASGHHHQGELDIQGNGAPNANEDGDAKDPCLTLTVKLP